MITVHPLKQERKNTQTYTYTHRHTANTQSRTDNRNLKFVTKKEEEEKWWWKKGKIIKERPNLIKSSAKQKDAKSRKTIRWKWDVNTRFCVDYIYIRVCSIEYSGASLIKIKKILLRILYYTTAKHILNLFQLTLKSSNNDSNGNSSNKKMCIKWNKHDVMLT